MKRKRYFCDWLKNIDEEKKIHLYTCIEIISIIIISIISINCYQLCTTKYGAEVKSYYEEKYPAFKDVGNKIILEDNEIEKIELEGKTKEQYPTIIKCFLCLASIIVGLFSYLIIFLFFSIIILIANYKSQIHKNIDMRRKIHKKSR